MPAPINVTFDTVDGTGLDVAISAAAASSTPSRFVRTGTAEGIDVTVVSGSPKYEAMFLAQNAIIAAAIASPLANHPEYIPQRVVLQPVSDVSVRFSLIYETLIFGLGVPPSTYVLTDGATSISRQSNYIVNADGQRIPIMLGWETASSNGVPPIPSDYVNMSFVFPWRVIQVDALVYGRPTNGQGGIRFANDATWPTETPTFPGQPETGPTPLPRGFWRLDEYVTRLNKYAGYYTLSARAVSRVIEDWSDLAILFNSKSGRYVQIGATPEDGQRIIDAAFSSQYEFGVFPCVDPRDDNDPPRQTGAARVGPYPVKSFFDIFGF